MDKKIKEYTLAGKKNLIIVYILYLCGIVAPVLPLIGVIFSYINKDTTNQTFSSHYTFLMRTFWLGLIGFIISKVLKIVFLGLIVLYFAVMAWFIIRVVIGFKFLLSDQAHPNPQTYWIQ